MSGGAGTTHGARRRVTLERTYAGATVDEVWEMWTTKDGIESWWGPDGFEVKVRSIDLRPGGQLAYAMIAIAPPQIEFMSKAGMPTVNECRLTYTELAAPRRLAYTHVVDFVPGTAPYDVSHLVELYAVDGGVRLVLTFDAMHDEPWTQRAVMGWQMELGKLEAALAATT
jgi:uncharacterized protein YndB with AHSA1/START domain